MPHLTQLLLTSLVLVGSSATFAQNGDYIPLYRSKDANFASGQAQYDTLKKNMVGFDFEIWRKLTISQTNLQKSVWLPKSHILTLPDLEPMPSTRLGPYVTLQHARLRKEKDLTSQALKLFAPGTRLIPLVHYHDWVEVSVDGQRGFVHFSEVTGKMDLASYGLPAKTKKWLRIEKRIGSRIYFENGIKKELHEIEGFAGDQNLGVLINRDFNKHPDLKVLEKALMLGVRGSVQEAKSQRWAQSEVPGHGTVWWRIPENQIKVRAPNKISMEELLRKNIYSFDFDEKKPTHGVVSADGIFVTEDGKSFEKIESLGNLNVPVRISPSGKWFVGSYVSNNGKSNFKEYVNWAEITQQLQRHLNRAPRKLQMKDIEVSKVKPETWTLTVDTGDRTMKLLSRNNGDSWNIQ